MHRLAPVVEPGKPDHLAPRHPVPNRDPDLAEIRVGGPHLTTVIDGHTEHPGDVSGEGDRPGRGGPHRTAGGDPEIDPPVTAVEAGRGERRDHGTGSR